MGICLDPHVLDALDALAVVYEVPSSTLCWAIVHEWVERHAYLEAQGKVRMPTRARVAAASVELDLGAQVRGGPTRFSDGSKKS